MNKVVWAIASPIARRGLLEAAAEIRAEAQRYHEYGRCARATVAGVLDRLALDERAIPLALRDVLVTALPEDGFSSQMRSLFGQPDDVQGDWLDSQRTAIAAEQTPPVEVECLDCATRFKMPVEVAMTEPYKRLCRSCLVRAFGRSLARVLSFQSRLRD